MLISQFISLKLRVFFQAPKCISTINCISTKPPNVYRQLCQRGTSSITWFEQNSLSIILTPENFSLDAWNLLRLITLYSHFWPNITPHPTDHRWQGDLFKLRILPYHSSFFIKPPNDFPTQYDFSPNTLPCPWCLTWMALTCIPILITRHCLHDPIESQTFWLYFCPWTHQDLSYLKSFALV